ncbi:hypothetical protein HC341_06560 [Aquisalimonas sp. 2447]|uniref:hypothetical protein n=1 Tax=Aquisalimonas sp. 2447 TaxID=2740807 RepID=UPI0014326DB0|nr:hypothetical protein [Aquisalimonas sp. 2447]QIT54907.1 hypothetical protein HC341_06560 [Aquisalimonas sp. 2447]
MSARIRSRNVWFGLLLGGLGAFYVWIMAATGVAELPHTLAALTVLIPLVLFGVVLRSPWPAAAALVIVAVIDLTLS